VARQPELPHQEHVERRAQRAGDLERYRDPAAWEAQDEDVRAVGVGPEPLREPLTRLGPVFEEHGRGPPIHGRTPRRPIPAPLADRGLPGCRRRYLPVTRTISVVVVTPRSTFSSAASRSVRIPSSRATLKMSGAPAPAVTRPRIFSVSGRISKTPTRPL
jgi:hypothetical protein